jgi:hypothetical protein
MLRRERQFHLAAELHQIEFPKEALPSARCSKDQRVYYTKMFFLFSYNNPLKTVH